MDIKYPENLIDNDSGLNAYVKFTEFQRQVDLTTSVPSNSICLYMPDDITNPTSPQWEEKNLTEMGGDLLQAGMKSKQDRLQNTANDIRTRLGETSTEFTNISNSLNKFNKISGIVSNIGKGIEDINKQYQFKRIPNPYTVMVFKGVDLREFDMSFYFYPLSQNDTKTIQKIITMFHSGALPDDQGGIALGYPNEWEIEFMFNGEQNPYMPIFKRCVLQSINTNYTGNGFWSMTRDGAPATIKIDLKFKENEIMVREDYDYSFDATDNWLVNMNADINNASKEYFGGSNLMGTIGTLINGKTGTQEILDLLF